MSLERLQAVWESHGRADPLWAVLSDPARRGRKWDIDEFFATGRAHADAVVANLARVGLHHAGGRCLDFGCGPGRITQGLCAHFDEADGVDISPAMIDLARERNRFGEACRYHVNAEPDLSLFDDATFDAVVSFIVLQHIDPEHSTRYVSEFARVTKRGGAIVFQLPSHPRPPAPAEPLPDGAFGASITLAEPVPASVSPGATIVVSVDVTNEGSATWPGMVEGGGSCSVRLANHWLGFRRVHQLDDGRSALPRDIEPGTAVRMTLSVTAPARPGRYRLELDLVQEHVAWFADKGSTTLRVPVRVGRSAPPTAHDLDDDVDEPEPFAMHCVPRDQVVALLADAGAEVVAVDEEHYAGPEFVSYTYYAVKR